MKYVVALLLLVPLIFLRGWVLLNMWGWFIIPLGAPGITMAHALGISMILSFMVNDPDSREKSSEESLKYFIMTFASPLITLLIGWILHSFM